MCARFLLVHTSLARSPLPPPSSQGSSSRALAFTFGGCCASSSRDVIGRSQSLESSRRSQSFESSRRSQSFESSRRPCLSLLRGGSDITCVFSSDVREEVAGETPPTEPEPQVATHTHTRAIESDDAAAVGSMCDSRFFGVCGGDILTRQSPPSERATHFRCLGCCGPSSSVDHCLKNGSHSCGETTYHQRLLGCPYVHSLFIMIRTRSRSVVTCVLSLSANRSQ